MKNATLQARILVITFESSIMNLRIRYCKSIRADDRHMVGLLLCIESKRKELRRTRPSALRPGIRFSRPRHVIKIHTPLSYPLHVWCKAGDDSSAIRFGLNTLQEIQGFQLKVLYV